MGRDNGTISTLSGDMKNCLKETEETNKVLSDRTSQLYRTIQRCSFLYICTCICVYIVYVSGIAPKTEA